MIKSQIRFRGIAIGHDWRAAEFEWLDGWHPEFRLNEKALKDRIGHLTGHDTTEERRALSALGQT